MNRRGPLPNNESYGIAPRRMILLGHSGSVDDTQEPWRHADAETLSGDDEDDHGVMEMQDDSEAELDSHLQQADSKQRNAREDTPGPESSKSTSSESKPAEITNSPVQEHQGKDSASSEHRSAQSQ